MDNDREYGRRFKEKVKKTHVVFLFFTFLRRKWNRIESFYAVDDESNEWNRLDDEQSVRPGGILLYKS